MAVWKCGGRHRVDDAGNPVCSYKADIPWRGRCPGCNQPFSCDQIGTERSGRKLSSAADAQQMEDVKHVASGMKSFDFLTNGGLVPSQGQVILLAGQPGTRKTSFMLKVLDQLTKSTIRPLLFASAEQNETDVKMFCKVVGVSSDQVKIMGNLNHIDDMLNLCDEVKPIVTVLDSLQAVSRNCGIMPEAVAQHFVKYCKRRKMAGIAINHMTKALEVAGGTGPAHYVDTVLAFEPYIPEVDGDPFKNFGKAQLLDAQVEIDSIFPDQPVKNLRVLKCIGKNRYGSIGNEVYLFTTNSGDLIELERKSNVIAMPR